MSCWPSALHISCGTFSPGPIATPASWSSLASLGSWLVPWPRTFLVSEEYPFSFSTLLCFVFLIFLFDFASFFPRSAGRATSRSWCHSSCTLLWQDITSSGLFSITCGTHSTLTCRPSPSTSSLGFQLPSGSQPCTSPTFATRTFATDSKMSLTSPGKVTPS